MEILKDFVEVTTVAFALGLGFILKNWIKDVDNKWIPTIVGIAGVLFYSWLKGGFTPEGVVIGLISGLSSTGLHQAFKAYISNENNSEGTK